MNYLKRAFAPIEPPDTTVGRWLYEAGNWCCDNLSALMVAIPTAALVALSLPIGP